MFRMMSTEQCQLHHTASSSIAKKGRKRMRSRRKTILSPLIITSLIVGTNSLALNIRQSAVHCKSFQYHPFDSITKQRSNCLHKSCTDLDTTPRRPTQLRQSTSTNTPIEDDDSQSANTKSIKSFYSKLIASRDLSVPAVLIAAFLNLLGFTMASPIQPALGKHFSLPLGASFGSLSSAYPLGMMLGVFLWPTLSDVVGRKSVMSLTLFGSGMGLMLQSWGIQRHWTLEQFLAARVLTGCFAGNGPVSKAFLADRGGKNGDLTKYLAWRDAASTLAFIVGPVLGGLLYQGAKQVVGAVEAVPGVTDNTKRISFVIRFSAVASLLASAAVMFLVKGHDVVQSSETKKSERESNAPKIDDPTTNAKDNTSDTSAKAETNAKKPDEIIISCPLGTKLWTGVVTVAGVSGLYHAADSAFFAFFPSLLQQKLNFDTQAVGLAFTSFAFISFGMSAFVSSRFIKLWGPVAACVTGLGAVGTALMALGYATSLPVGAGLGVAILGSAALYYAGVPLYGPTVPTMLLQCVPPHKRGAVMGFDGTVNTLARVISPIAMGEILRRRGVSACFKVAASLVYGGALLALFRRWLVLRKEFARSQTSAIGSISDN